MLNFKDTTLLCLFWSTSSTINSPISQFFPLAVSSLNNTIQLICYNSQLMIVEQCFTNIAAIQNHRGIIANFNLQNLLWDITDMSKYHNAGIWRIDQNLLRFMFKIIKHLK